MGELKNKFQDFIDKLQPSKVDRYIYISMIISSIMTCYLFISTFTIFFNIEINVHSKILYSVLIINAVMVFYLSLLGEKLSKPVLRPRIYLFTTTSIAILTYSVLAESFNSFFVGVINTLIDMTTVPIFVVQTNSKILTVLVPVIIVSIGFYKSMTIAFKKEYKSDLQEYTVDFLTRNVEKIDKYNIDCKICEDFETGQPIYLTEKQSFRHMLIAGNSGSGKTSLVLRPYISQLFYKKALFREELKQLTLEALNEGLCEIKVPVTNKYFNENFSMDLIKINDERKDEFLEKYKKLILGVRATDNQIYNSVVKNGFTSIDIPIKKDVIKTIVHVTTLIAGIEEEEYTITYNSSELMPKNIENDKYSIRIKPYSNKEESSRTGIDIEFACKLDNKDLYTYKVVVNQDTKGKIIYRNTGVTTIAPDSGLGEQTVKIGKANGVKVYKIDPKLEEIRKGHIATYNPMMLGDPEKTGDIIASILIGMEDGEIDSYYKNAGMRAIRNLTILLRVAYPIVKPGKNPTLIDLLELMNDFSKAEILCEEIKKDKVLVGRWKTVIEYMESNFYEMKVDGQGNRVKGTNYGINRKKCQEAITGTINQLDNFIGREEIRYILCNEEQGLNLNDVLENGECIAIATRQAELGDVIGRAFALFFIMSIQTAVLSRYSEDEAPEIPYEILIDEFPFYLNDQSKIFFTFSRKYKCSVTCVIQGIAQLREQSETFREIILTNTNSKLILPGSNVEDRMYYSELLGFEDVFEVQTGISSTPMFSDNARYVESKSGTITEKNRVSKEELATLKFKNCYYSVTDVKGNMKIGKGTLDFLDLTNENTIKNNILDFSNHLKDISSNSNSNINNSSELEEEVKLNRVAVKVEDTSNGYDQFADGIDDAECVSQGLEPMTESKLDENTVEQNVKPNQHIKEKNKQSSNQLDKYNANLDGVTNFDNSNLEDDFSETNIVEVQKEIIQNVVAESEPVMKVKDNSKKESITKDTWERETIEKLHKFLLHKGQNPNSKVIKDIIKLQTYEGTILSDEINFELDKIKNIFPYITLKNKGIPYVFYRECDINLINGIKAQGECENKNIKVRKDAERVI